MLLNLMHVCTFTSLFRKNLYVWDLQTCELVKILDAHFGRIISLEPLTIGNWNSVINNFKN